nr:DUF421 domain-containing protein [Paenibacillus xylanexedens]
MTVHKSPLKASVTVEDLGLTKTDQSIAYPLILEGKVSKRVSLQLSTEGILIVFPNEFLWLAMD